MNTSIELSLLFTIITQIAQLSYCMGIMVAPWGGDFLRPTLLVGKSAVGALVSF